MELWVLFAFLCLSLILIFRKYIRAGKALEMPENVDFPPEWESILLHSVAFYQGLSETDKTKFKDKVSFFISRIPITGADVDIDDQTRVLVAASAVIPVFRLPNWHYINLSEVIIYGDPIENYRIESAGIINSIVGQVRPFQNSQVVLLSKPLLFAGFSSYNKDENVGIHEFSHLIDQVDGSTDGVPEVLLTKELQKPWFHLMYKEIEKMKKGKSDINPYGLTNHAEFFAVVSEYFFEEPEKFQKKHPELYQILAKAFKIPMVETMG